MEEEVEVVVKIPQKWLDAMIREEFEDVDELCTVIQHGIQLPKGHGALKDTDKIISGICGSSCGCHLEECGHDAPCYSVARIISASTIIEADKDREEA